MIRHLHPSTRQGTNGKQYIKPQIASTQRRGERGGKKRTSYLVLDFLCRRATSFFKYCGPRAVAARTSKYRHTLPTCTTNGNAGSTIPAMSAAGLPRPCMSRRNTGDVQHFLLCYRGFERGKQHCYGWRANQTESDLQARCLPSGSEGCSHHSFTLENT